MLDVLAQRPWARIGRRTDRTDQRRKLANALTVTPARNWLRALR